MTAFNPARFIREVRQEMAKVTWPTRKETLASTGVTLLLVLVAAIAFLVIDNVIKILVKLVLGF